MVSCISGPLSLVTQIRITASVGRECHNIFESNDLIIKKEKTKNILMNFVAEFSVPKMVEHHPCFFKLCITPVVLLHCGPFL